MRREAETHAKEQVKIEEERKSVALALQELEPEALDRSIETCRTERERLLLEQAQFVTTGDIKSLRDKLTAGTPCPVCGSLSILSPLTEAHERLLALADRISELPCASSGFSTGKNGRRPAGNNSPPCNRKNWSCINNSPRTRTHGRN